MLSKITVLTQAVFVIALALLVQGCGDEPGCGTLGCSKEDMTLTTNGTTPQGGKGGATKTGTNSVPNGGGGMTGASSASSASGGNTSGTGGKTTPTGGGEAASVCGYDGKEINLAVHVALDVTWPSTLGTAGGTSKFHVWSLNTLTPSGNAFAGTYKSCGTSIPETTMAAITGGGKLLVEVPMSLWDQEAPLRFQVKGTLGSSWAANSAITSAGDPAVVGLTLTDPVGAWPTTYAAVTPVDVDKDGKPGMTAVPKAGSGYVNPPLSIMGPLGPRADRVYLANRTQVELEGTFTSCTEHSGNATPIFLDTHVVGCHVAGGSECNATQTKFVDDNRMVYVPTGGTYKAKVVPDTTTCAEVRAALPKE